MAKRPLPNSGKARNMTVNQFTVSKAVNFPGMQAAVASATGNGDGNGKGGGKKDDTLTKDEFNSGFQDGVGQIKDGFSSLGAGLGPLQVIVDFVKGFVSKIGNLFTIFKGFFNILMSIPKAIANAFKKKDKDDDKKDGKKGKLKNALEKGKKKERDKDRKDAKKGRGGFMRFATMLKPALIVGAVLAISTGLIMLYNWLVGKGLFQYFDKLSTDIRVGLLNTRITLAEIFNKDEKAQQLETEKSDLILRKRVLNNMSQEEREGFEKLSAPAKTKFLATQAEQKGANLVNTQELLSSTAGQSKDLQKGLKKLDVKPVSTIAQGEYNVKINQQTLDLLENTTFTELTRDADIGSTFRADGKYKHVEEHMFSESVYGRTTFDLDGKPMTIGDLARLIQESGGIDPGSGEPLITPEQATNRAREMVVSAPGIIIGKDNELIMDRFTDPSIGMPGYQLAEQTENGGFIRDISGQSRAKDLFSGDYAEFDERGIKKEEKGFFGKVFSLDTIPILGQYRKFKATKRNEFLSSEGYMDDLAKNIFQENEITEDLDKATDNANELSVRELMRRKNDGEDLTEEQLRFLELMEMYQEAGGETDNFSYARIPFDGRTKRPDEFYNTSTRTHHRSGIDIIDYEQMSDEQITEMFIVQAMDSMDIDREAATTIVNSYIDNNESMTQYVTPQNDNGQNTGSGNQTVDVTQ